MDVGVRCVSVDEPKHIHDMGCRWSRVSLHWPSIQPERGVFDFSYYEPIVAKAAELGLSMTAELYPFRQTFPDDHWTWRGARGMVPDPGAWQDFVCTVVNRFKKYIQHWEIWCEPNCMSCNPMNYYDTDSFIHVLKTTSTMIRDIDSSARIVAGGLWLNGLTRMYIDALAKPDVLPYFDVVSWHYYLMASSNDARHFAASKDILDKWMRFIRSRFPEHYPIWITEFGIPTKMGDSELLDSSTRGQIIGLSLDEQAEWFSEFAETASREWDLDKVFFLILKDIGDQGRHFGFSTGLQLPDGTPKPIIESISQFEMSKRCTDGQK